MCRLEYPKSEEKSMIKSLKYFIKKFENILSLQF
jgi:hypothetical protein